MQVFTVSVLKPYMCVSQLSITNVLMRCTDANGAALSSLKPNKESQIEVAYTETLYILQRCARFLHFFSYYPAWITDV